jgi:hypothetical protein
MVVLMLATALAGRSNDDMLDVVVLPVPRTHAAAAEVEAALARAVPPGFLAEGVTGDAREMLLTQPACRFQPRCSGAWLPEKRLLLAADVEDRGVFLPRRGVGRSLDADVSGLLTPWHPSVVFYERAVRGDTSARESLLTRFPESPWAKALDGVDP